MVRSKAISAGRMSRKGPLQRWPSPAAQQVEPAEKAAPTAAASLSNARPTSDRDSKHGDKLFRAATPSVSSSSLGSHHLGEDTGHDDNDTFAQDVDELHADEEASARSSTEDEPKENSQDNLEKSDENAELGHDGEAADEDAIARPLLGRQELPAPSVVTHTQSEDTETMSEPDLGASECAQLTGGRREGSEGSRSSSMGKRSRSVPPTSQEYTAPAARKRNRQTIEPENHHVPEETNKTVESADTSAAGAKEESVSPFLDFEKMPGDEVEPFDSEALASDYEKVNQEYNAKMEAVLEEWHQLNDKIERWAIRGIQVQTIRETCMLGRNIQDVQEQVQKATKQREDLVSFCGHMQAAFNMFFQDAM